MPRNSYHDTPVVEFHEAFGAPVAWKPGIPPQDRRELRCKLVLEELLEFITACGLTLTVNGQDIMIGHVLDLIVVGENKPDLIEAGDALTDLRYVIDGACLEFGLPAEKMLREVHRSNMSKLGPDGQPLLRADGKILKGPNYTPPDLKSIIDLYSEINNRG